MGPHIRTSLLALFAIFFSAAIAAPAAAFCGFYVSGADGSLYANATMVVMMRSGNQTVLSMQNNYQGPPEDFAMVIPVPVVLQEADVKTLPHEVFTHVDALAAPRLVEYWEQDPCYEEPEYEYDDEGQEYPSPPAEVTEDMSGGEAFGVEIEAEFAVAEYDIVILSARDSSGLDSWLRQENYNIPSGAEAVLRGYVEAGTKFFVAKIDAERVTFENGQALLSPLRFHYQSEDFSLPVRLGLLNSAGEQDLIVHILSPNARFETANYPNARIPTNLVVDESVRHRFASFYEALFQATVAQNPGAVVTEYAWSAGSCDPCPTPSLDPSEIELLGNDVLQADAWSMVLTRLHYRYDENGLEHDLVFRQTDGLMGGSGMPDQQGHIEQNTQESSQSAFQGRYVILNPWEGDMSCSSPNRGTWGGPPNGQQQTQSATNRALLGSSVQPIDNLASVVSGSVAPLSIEGTAPAARLEGSRGGCASCSLTGEQSAWPILLVLVGLFAATRKRP